MSETKKPKIQAIYALSFMQQGLLFHHLSSDVDQGFLNVECYIEGSIDFILFERAWNIITKRHEVMRSTVHWEKIEKPVQIVHQEKTIKFSFLDYNLYSKEDQESKWDELKTKYRRQGTNFQEGALLDIILVSLGINEHRLLWPSHHLLIDGWSSNNILKDVFQVYDAILNGLEPTFETLPSHKSYLNWLSQTDTAEAQKFWKNYFEGYKKSSLFDERNSYNETSTPNTTSISLSREETIELQKFARDIKVSLNTVLQGVWALLLIRYFGTNDMVHGTTVSSRSSDFPRIELLTGMYTNVQPIRNRISDEKKLFTEWFKENQKRQQEASKYEHTGIDDLMAFIERPVGLTLFDSLFVFENHPVVETTNEALKITNFKSGLTSTYPVTMIVLPSDKIKFTLSVSPDSIHKESAFWLLNNYHTIITNLIGEKEYTYSDLKEQIPICDTKLVHTKVSPRVREVNQVEHTSETQTKLSGIWEDLFGFTGISIHDDFFELGGKSMLAVKMVTQIQKRLGEKIAPTLLLKNPTIASLSAIIDGEGVQNKFKYLVPLKERGTKAPLFCIHAGGGHVFFYNHLANLIDEDRPVYAIEPSGISHESDMHQDIEQMATDYINEIQTTFRKGPYHIMVYCFSTAVGIEMSAQLNKLGKNAHLIVMDTMAEQERVFVESRIKMRVFGFIKRFFNEPIKSLNIMVMDRVNRFLKPKWIQVFGSVQEKDIERVRKNLSRLYSKYIWKKRPIKVSLILTEKPVASFNEEVLGSWQKLASNGVDVFHTEGNHRTLFEEPDVRHVARTIDNCIENRV